MITTTLCKSIKFRSMMDQLSKQEFIQFMSKMFDYNKTNIIKTSLFNQLIESTNNNDDEINDINSILSNIIQSRKTKPKPLPTNNIKCDQLPTQVIGHIASFLDQTNYFQFQIANRSLFIGCNTPNMLQTLDLINIEDYKSINLRQYRSLKQFEVNMHEFNQLVLSNNNEQFIMNALNELVLDAKEENDCDIEPFMSQNCINIENIKTLRLLDFGDIGPEQEFSFSKLWRLLMKFANIEYLDLFNIFPDDNNIDTDKWKELYPNLKGLSVNGGERRMNDRLVNVFGNNLYFLRLMGIAGNGDIDFKNTNFNKLEELMLINLDNHTINDILKTARNLKKFCIEESEQNEDELNLKTVIPQILKCKPLEYFEIETNNKKHSEAILEGIEIGLHETKKLERKQLKMRVCAVEMESGFDIKRAIFHIGGIILRLESSNIKQFMFIMDLSTLNQQLDEKQILNDLNDISSNVQVIADGLCFVITNKKCKINGWSESWMM